MVEIEREQLGRVDAGLRPDQLQFVPAQLGERIAGLGADAEPVDAGRRG